MRFYGQLTLTYFVALNSQERLSLGILAMYDTDTLMVKQTHPPHHP